jgi:hypothetical protein
VLILKYIVLVRSSTLFGVPDSAMAPDGSRPMSIDTAVIHTGVPKVLGSAVMPIFQSATYGYSGDGNEDLVGYTRPADSPNHHVRRLYPYQSEILPSSAQIQDAMIVQRCSLLTLL